MFRISFLHQWFILLFCGVAGIIATGCRPHPQPPEEMPPLTPCIIEVSFGNEKIEKVGVMFRPKNGSRWGAGGLTDSNGQAVMKTAGPFEGVVPGEYTISFEKKVAPKNPKNMAAPRLSLIPIKYDHQHSELNVVVTKDQKVYSFELEKGEENDQRVKK
ncbi:MAG: hypothetical protein LBG58_09955 [Planctomycetaceae bacterium]|nr:hypothetical protein [Planctomycetaceae bacterium]